MNVQRRKKGVDAEKEASIWNKAFSAGSDWDDKDEFLDVIYWLRQVLAIIIGILWAIIPLKGIVGLVLFALINAGVVFIYFTSFQKIDDEDYGGPMELTKEGFFTSFSLFLGYLLLLKHDKFAVKWIYNILGNMDHWIYSITPNLRHSMDTDSENGLVLEKLTAK